MRLVCLHGFLGLPSDWNFLGPKLKSAGFDAEVISIDLWKYVPKSFGQVASEVSKLLMPEDVLLGYSMGGRLASQSFFLGETRKQGRLIVVSAHYGGLNDEEMRSRSLRDEEWAAKFENDEWESLKRDWSSQPVFAGDGTSKLARNMADFDRAALAHALRQWSVVNQPDSRPLIEKTTRPVLWLAGEHDTKYASATRELTGLSPLLQTKVVEGAGHRLPWGSKDAFVFELVDFLSK